jgi:phospholipase D1/2
MLYVFSFVFIGEGANEQRQMHQFIVSMERIAAQSAWTGMNRFDSFAPLRVNVAAQWLVDGVSHLMFN